MPPSAYQTPNTKLEASLLSQKIQHIAGVDEAGRGAWAGPVTAAAVVLPPPGKTIKKKLSGLHDSKRLTPKRREEWDGVLRELALDLSVGEASVEEIDRIGILPATRLAMCRAVEGLEISVQHLLVDYILIGDVGVDQTAIPRGDARSLSIAAASVVAKVARDRVMVSLDQEDPRYGFAQHKGYGTRQHRAALETHGPIAQHRRSFAPIQGMLL